MASKTVLDAVEARIGAVWSSADGSALPVVPLNQQGMTPADGSAFITIEYPVANERQLTLGAPGSNHWKEDGAFRVVINQQRGVGLAQAQGWADELRTLFRGQAFGGVQCFAPSAPVVNDMNDQGNYWQMSFAVPYWAYVVG